MSGTDVRREVAAGTSDISAGLLFTLGLLAALGPFAIDLYLSAFPAMVEDLQTGPTGVQLSLTAYLVGVACGQLTFGPLSDRFGRRRPLLIGLLVCVIASIAAALAPTLGVLIVARAVQGFAAASGAVIGRAIISDLATGNAAARAFSIMMIVGGVAPIIAPVLGSLIGAVLAWRGILATVGVLALALFVVIAIGVRESHTVERRAALRAHTDPRSGSISALWSRVFIGNTLTMAFATAVMMSYISASPFVFQRMIGMTPLQFGLLFGTNATAMLLVNWGSARLIGRYAVRRILGVGVAVMMAAVASLVIVEMLDLPPIALLPPLFIAIASVGAVMPKATSQALAEVPHVAGTGSALLGATQFGVSALAVPLVGLAGESSALPFVLVMASCAAIMGAAFLLARPRSPKVHSAP